MDSLLFITWDGPQVNYLEGLFLPILHGLKDRYEIHVIQFTWGEAARVDRLKALFESYGLRYTSFAITRKPIVALGTMWALMRGRRFLKDYISRHQIDIVFPRSTFPAWMVSGIWERIHTGRKLVFDMDGFPLEERVDFVGLDPRGFQYNFFKKREQDVIRKASVVLVRTRAAIEILHRGSPWGIDKFQVVINGRDSDFFTPSPQEARGTVRAELGVKEEEILLVYSGSLGAQYCVDEMLFLFGELSAGEGRVKFLVLTGNPEYIERMSITSSLRERMIVRSVPFLQVPRYLGAADIGLAIRANAPSMKGVAPVKLGEYLLCGLPVIASKGIGDTEDLLSGQKGVYLLPDHGNPALQQAVVWMGQVIREKGIMENVRAIGLKYFSLKSSIASYNDAFNHLD